MVAEGGDAAEAHLPEVEVDVGTVRFPCLSCREVSLVGDSGALEGTSYVCLSYNVLTLCDLFYEYARLSMPFKCWNPFKVDRDRERVQN